MPARSRIHRGAHVGVAALACLLGIARLSVGNQPLPADSAGRHVHELVRMLVRAETDGIRHPSSISASVRVLTIDQSGEWAPASGIVDVTLPSSIDVRAGDVMTAFGRLEPAGGAAAPASYAAFLDRRGVVASLYYPRVALVQRDDRGGFGGAWRRVRDRLESGLSSHLETREALFASALLFGDHHALPADLRQDLARTGTSHLVIVSAFNLMLLYGTLIAVLAPFVGRRRSVLFATCVALGYGFAAGQSAAVARAEILIVLLGLATLSGRPFSRPALLVVAAAAMTSVDPAAIGDVGFQLTFAAAAGIAMLAPPFALAINRLLEWAESFRAVPAPIAAVIEAGSVSLAVSIATLPVMVSAFGALNPYAPIANALLNPLVPLLKGLTLAAAATGVLSGILGALLAAPLWLSLVAAERVLHVLAYLPLASISVSIPERLFTVCWYGALFITWRFAPAVRHRFGAPVRLQPDMRRRRRRARAPRWLSYAAVAVVAFLLAFPTVTKARAGLASDTAASVVWLDAGSRMAFLVRGRNHVRLLVVDDETIVSPSLAVRLTEHGAAHIDGLVLLREPATDDVSASLSAAMRIVHASSILYPSGRPQADRGLARQRRLDGAVAVSGKAVVDLGGGDRVTLLTDAAGVGALRFSLSGHSLLAGTISLAGRLLKRWQEAQQIEVLIATSKPPERSRDALDSLHPAVVVLPGHAAHDADVLTSGGAASIRLVGAADVRDLRISTERDQLALFYRDR